MGEWIANIKLVKIIVFATTLLAIRYLKVSHRIHRLVLLILGINFLTELTTLILRSLHLPYNKVTTLNIIAEHCLWLYLLGVLVQRIRLAYGLIGVFVCFSVVNFLFIQGMTNFNYYTFILGSLFYIIFFFAESFIQLDKENFEFIFSNNYLILCAPVIFLFGVSVMFAFVSREVTTVKVFFGRELFSWVIDYVNGIYYLLVSIYILKEAKLKNE